MISDNVRLTKEQIGALADLVEDSTSGKPSLELHYPFGTDVLRVQIIACRPGVTNFAAVYSDGSIRPA